VATWSGWEAQFLRAAGILNTPPNQRFLTNWASHASAPNCRDNPIDLSEKASGSANCVKPAGDFPWIQRYSSHASAAQAFNRQIHTRFASVILAAMQSGNPFQFKDWQDVAGQLRQWPSINFATWYIGQMQGGGSGGGGGGALAPQTHKAWSDLQRALNSRLPSSINSAQRASRAALRAAGRARRVRH
jgi:hypothetical protein